MQNQDVFQFITLVSGGGQSCDQLRECVDKILIGMGMNVDGKCLERLSTALETVKDLSNFRVTIWESDGRQQTAKVSSLGELLKKTLEGNFHTVHAKCQGFDAKTGECKNNNSFIPGTTDHVFGCDYHPNDSVAEHLVLACLHNALWAIENHMSDRMIMLCAFLGLYHDIGKPLTVSTYERPGQTFTGFPCHGEVGSMLFQTHWHPDMSRLISKEDFMNVSTAILRHMCGCHGDENASVQYARNLLLLEQPPVRDLLVVNRVGDHLGKPLVESLVESNESKLDQHFLEQTLLFKERMENKQPFNFSSLMRDHVDKLGHLSPNKACLFMVGNSGAGKTYLVTELMKRFPITYVSRDECIASVTVGVHARLEGADYIKMYHIYEAGKTLNGFARKSAGPQKLDRREMAKFESAKQNFIKAQVSWNAYRRTSPNRETFPEIKVYDPSNDPVPTISNQVDCLFKKEIYDAMNDPNPFMVIDTFMSCFPMGIEAGVPPELANFFRVHVHVQSYCERKTSTVSTLSNQLAIAGPYGLDNLMHPNGFKKATWKKSFTSLSADRTIGQLPSSTFRPHLVTVCTRTEDGGDIGYEQTFDCLSRLSASLTM